MAITVSQKKQLEKIVQLAESLLDSTDIDTSAAGSNGSSKRIRRTGKELVAFRKRLKAERKKGTPVAQIAKENGVSAAYIYQL